jgi:TonB family protein
MKRLLAIIIMLAAAAAAGADEGFTPAVAVHIEPLGDVEIPKNKLVVDTVMVQLTIDDAGNVTDAAIWSSSGDDGIDAAALEAAKKCTFIPAKQDGEPIPSWYQVYYRLSTHRTMEYVGPKEKEEKGGGPPPPAGDDGGRD